MEAEETLLAFLHLATHTDHVILDGTARQFDRDLPAAWITPRADYLHRLAAAAGIDHATIVSRQPTPELSDQASMCWCGRA